MGAACGVAGWLLENTVASAQGRPPRFSKAFGGATVPWLPVYAAGGVAVALAAPTLASASLPLRFVTYAAGLSALELAACVGDRRLEGGPSWHYPGGGLGGCVDLKHAAVWGGLALLLEHALRS